MTIAAVLLDLAKFLAARGHDVADAVAEDLKGRPGLRDAPAPAAKKNIDSEIDAMIDGS